MPVAGPPGPPGFPVWQAPPEWRAIDFISDLHLAPTSPNTVAAWARYLGATAADAVVILGDLFELWVGDDARTLPFESGLVATLRAAAAKRPLFFMVGNRDFLVGNELLAEVGMMALPDPACLHAFGQRLVLAHGDALCLSDLPYQALRRQMRDLQWQRATLARPLRERLALGAEIRRRSEQRRQFDGAPDADVDPAAAIALLDACGSQVLIHGHTHRPGTLPLDATHTRHVLSDWDLDDPTRPRAEVLRLSAAGVERLDPQRAAPAS